MVKARYRLIPVWYDRLTHEMVGRGFFWNLLFLLVFSIDSSAVKPIVTPVILESHGKAKVSPFLYFSIVFFVVGMIYTNCFWIEVWGRVALNILITAHLGAQYFATTTEQRIG